MRNNYFETMKKVHYAIKHANITSPKHKVNVLIQLVNANFKSPRRLV